MNCNTIVISGIISHFKIGVVVREVFDVLSVVALVSTFFILNF